MSTENTELEVKRAVQLSIAEIGLGSIGHGFKIPLTGQVLSLNQLAFLLNAINRDGLPKYSVFEISGIAAIMKSFSPAGKKLGPMLSIAMQGFLFWLGIVFLGLNVFGQMVGAVLLCLWSFIQPLITLFVIYGSDLISISEFYFKKVNEDYSFIATSVIYALVSVVILKVSIALGMVIYSRSYKKEITVMKDGPAFVWRQFSTQKSQNPVRAALKDLFKPLFLLSFILMIAFVWQMNGSFAQKIWLSLRPLAIAFILFYLLRSNWVSKKLMELSKKSESFARIYNKSQEALKQLGNRL